MELPPATELLASEATALVHVSVQSRWTVGELAELATGSVHVVSFVVAALLTASWLRSREGSRAARGARNAWRLIGAPFALVVLVAVLRDPGNDLPSLPQPEGIELPTAPEPRSSGVGARELVAQVLAVDWTGASSGWNGRSWVAVHRSHRLVPASEEGPTLIYADRGAPLDALNAIMEVVAAASDVRLVMMGTHHAELAHDRWAFTRSARPRPVGGVGAGGLNPRQLAFLPAIP